MSVGQAGGGGLDLCLGYAGVCACWMLLGAQETPLSK